MNTVIHTDVDRLTAHAEGIKQALLRLEQDCSVCARKREEKDLVDLMEDLKGVERDISLLWTDCICEGCPCEEDTPNGLSHDLHEIFACLDTLFNRLKKARMQSRQTYIHHAILDHLEIDYGRFSKLIANVQRHLNAQQVQPHGLLEEPRFHPAQGHAATV